MWPLITHNFTVETIENYCEVIKNVKNIAHKAERETICDNNKKVKVVIRNQQY